MLFSETNKNLTALLTLFQYGKIKGFFPEKRKSLCA